MTIQPYFCINLVAHRLSFQKKYGFSSQISVYICQNWQRMPKNRGNVLFWGESVLDILAITCTCTYLKQL